MGFKRGLKKRFPKYTTFGYMFSYVICYLPAYNIFYYDFYSYCYFSDNIYYLAMNRGNTITDIPTAFIFYQQNKPVANIHRLRTALQFSYIFLGLNCDVLLSFSPTSSSKPLVVFFLTVKNLGQTIFICHILLTCKHGQKPGNGIKLKNRQIVSLKLH